MLHYTADISTELRAIARECLIEQDVNAKVDAVSALAESWKQGRLILNSSHRFSFPQTIPGRPPRPELVPPLSVEKRAMHTVAGRAALIHALAHIEFNAINLAVDAIWRFDSMPDAYYADWLKVAAEEAMHFSLLAKHLQSTGYTYGDFRAHNSLWDMAEKTQGDVLARMALVPRTLEARGLDASPVMRAKLAQAGDIAAAEILDIILRDEIGHVAIGNYWYAWLCQKRDLDVIETYAQLALQYKAPVLRGPFNLDARRAAGFTERELAELPGMAPR